MTTRNDQDDDQRSGVQTLDRAVAVLTAVARRSDAGAKLADVARDCTLNRATTHRLLQALAATGLIERDESESRYFIGYRIVHLAEAAADRFGLEAVTLAARRRLAEKTGDTVFLTARTGARMVCSARTEGSFPVRVLTLDVGAVRPLGVGAGGLAILAFLDDDEAERIARAFAGRYEEFNLDVARVQALCAETRARGYSIDADTVLEGVTGVGAPLRDGAGRAVASLSVAAVSQRMTPDRIEAIGRMLVEEAAELSREAALLSGAPALSGAADPGSG